MKRLSKRCPKIQYIDTVDKANGDVEAAVNAKLLELGE